MDDPVRSAQLEIDHCNKCGFCLPVCPTYQVSGDELASPRGRIAMVEALLAGEMDSVEGIGMSLDSCLGCRACETACPSGVRYHRILEVARSRRRPKLKFVPKQLLRLTRKPGRLKWALGMKDKLSRLPMPKSLSQYLPMLEYESQGFDSVSPKEAPHRWVQFFRGCVMDALYQDANEGTEGLLHLSGYEVVSPTDQGCCGAIHFHAGRMKEAKALARANIVAFEMADPDTPLVHTAGGCAAMMAEYGNLFADEPHWQARAEKLASRVRDWATVVREGDLPLRYQGAGERVTLQNSCHLVHVLQSGDDVRHLLQQVEGEEFLPLAGGQDFCCGSAGIFNFQETAWSLRVLDRRMEDVEALRPDRVLVNNPGCHMQMTWGVKRSPHPETPVEHAAHYLYRAALRSLETKVL